MWDCDSDRAKRGQFQRFMASLLVVASMIYDSEKIACKFTITADVNSLIEAKNGQQSCWSTCIFTAPWLQKELVYFLIFFKFKKWKSGLVLSTSLWWRIGHSGTPIFSSVSTASFCECIPGRYFFEILRHVKCSFSLFFFVFHLMLPILGSSACLIWLAQDMSR